MFFFLFSFFFFVSYFCIFSGFVLPKYQITLLSFRHQCRRRCRQSTNTMIVHMVTTLHGIQNYHTTWKREGYAFLFTGQFEIYLYQPNLKSTPLSFVFQRRRQRGVAAQVYLRLHQKSQNKKTKLKSPSFVTPKNWRSGKQENFH